MHYCDKLYGENEITEPVILELINCSSMQRLKGIDQYGYSDPRTAVKSNPTRFEHSLGVYLLLKKYGAPLEEQIAGLIHDVSHAAFSHCIDYVLAAGSEKKQSHQDNIFADFVRHSEIPSILKNHNLDLNYILNDKNFSLKEKELPALCADRIDYSLRDAIALGLRENGRYFLDQLEIDNNRWIFINFTAAAEYAKLFLDLNTNYYSDFAVAVMYKTVGDCLRYALTQGYIAETDLYTTDREVLEKIHHHVPSDLKLKSLFEKMNTQTGFKNDPDDYDAKVFCKSRMVDPPCRHNGEIKNISEIEQRWKEIIKQESKPKEYFLKFEK